MEDPFVEFLGQKRIIPQVHEDPDGGGQTCFFTRFSKLNNPKEIVSVFWKMVDGELVITTSKLSKVDFDIDKEIIQPFTKLLQETDGDSDDERFLPLCDLDDFQF